MTSAFADFGVFFGRHVVVAEISLSTVLPGRPVDINAFVQTHSAHGERKTSVMEIISAYVKNNTHRQPIAMMGSRQEVGWHVSRRALFSFHVEEMKQVLANTIWSEEF